MEFKIVCLFVLFLVVKVYGHPMMYRINEHRKLEPDFVPVSSTVIPLPIYQVGYGAYTPPPDGDKLRTFSKPAGPIELLTVKSKNKKPIPLEKGKNQPSPKAKELQSDLSQH